MLRQWMLFVVVGTSVFAQKPQTAAVPPTQAQQAQQAKQQALKEPPASFAKARIMNNIVAEADGRLRCITPSGRPCTATDIKELFAGINASSSIKQLALASPDGILLCQTAAGKACTATHVKELNAQIKVNYDLKMSKAGRVAAPIVK